MHEIISLEELGERYAKRVEALRKEGYGPRGPSDCFQAAILHMAVGDFKTMKNGKVKIPKGSRFYEKA